MKTVTNPTRPLLAALLVTPLAALHAGTPTSQENAVARQWAQDHVFHEDAHAPFSFMLDGREASEVLAAWQRTDVERELDAKDRERTRQWTDPASGLQVRLVATEYADFPVVEWTLWLKNTGKADTALLENIQGLDVRFELEDGGEFVLHGLRGDSCVAESFHPYALTLGPDTEKRCSPPAAGNKVSGKSTDGPDGWPYWNLQRPGGGVILAVGWPGQWKATFARDHERGLRVTLREKPAAAVLVLKAIK